MLVLSNEDVERIFTLEECLEPLEVAYIELAEGKAANRERTHTYFPVEDPRYPGFRFRFKSQEGGNLSSGVWALRITSDIAGVEKLEGGVERRRLIPAAPGKRYVGLVTLYSMESIEPLCIIHDSVMQKWRVAATSALGIRKLAREDSKLAGLFGTGWQAGAHLQALFHVRPDLEEVRVYSPTRASREKFAKEQSEITGRKITVVHEPRGAVEDCDIITCATAAMQPCFDGNLIKPGAHVTSITSPDGTVMRRELDDTTFDRADRIIVTSKEQIYHDKQIDILGPVEKGRISFEDIVSIGDLLRGKMKGRENDREITVFANNTGMGLQFAAVASKIYEKAREQGLGHDIPTDWFLEETTP